MNSVSKTLIILGVMLILLGLFWQFGGRYIKLGRLPGDIAIERENFKFYLPLTTSILLSLVLSFIVWVFKRF